MKKVVVIGSGIGGMSAAIRLKVMGYDTSVYESNAYPGGKLSELQLGSFRFDAGPSLFTLPQLVDDIFILAGKNPRDYFNYKSKKIACIYFWEDGTEFSASSNPTSFIKDASKTFDVKPKVLEDYLSHSEKIYNLTKGVFLEKSLHKASTFLTTETISALVNIFGMNLTKTMHAVNSKRLSNDKLIQLFNRFATYNGSSPYKTPGIMTMIPHLEHNVGTYFPEGGMHQITNSMYKLAQDIGVDFHFKKKVNQITTTDNKVTGVIVDQQNIESDIVVSNADVVPTYRNLLSNIKPPEKTLTQERSSSALIFYWGINKVFPNLDLHNILFSDEYKTEFEHLFEHNTISDDPTIYIHISSKECKTDAPDNKENWFVMINVPSNSGQDWDKLISEARELIIKKINRVLNTNIESLIEEESYLDPRLIEEKTSSYQGALYGSSSNSKFSAFLRHPNFKSKLKGMYFCGGSVHPGGGIPLCILSGKIVADLVEKRK